VLFVYVLRPVLARGLPFRASRVTWVVSRVSKLALTARIVSEFACFEALKALPIEKYIKSLFLGHVVKFEGKTLSCRVKTEEHAAGHNTPDTNEARGLKKFLSFVDFPAINDSHITRGVIRKPKPHVIQTPKCPPFESPSEGGVLCFILGWCSAVT
jgi:hypothetical protein